ncbi:AraC family transcriptional regulator [Nocardia sp. CA-151230]|uniref:AraC family transcriptional regulator n=1 Tax=Nocardia sp. CA-151230 TaxID=3239982 RepID=UPI003D905C72
MKPLARYAALSGYVEACRSAEIEPAPLMRAVGLDPASLGQQDRWISAAAVARLLEHSAAASGCADFGLRLAEHRRFSNLGPLSLVLREEPDVRKALRILQRYEHTYNEALRMRMTDANGVTTIRIDAELGEPVETRHFVELAMAVLHTILRRFLGTGWRPVAVCFTHSAPTGIDTHLRRFGPVIEFDHDFNGIVLETTDLQTPKRMADPHMRSYAQQVLDTLPSPQDITITYRVRQTIELLLPTGRCTSEHVARSLGLSRRALHRQLASSGETFSTLLTATRADLAGRMVMNPRHSLTDIADLLGFSALSNFSRWFHGHFGCSPTQWRSRPQTEPRPGP